MTRRSSVVAFFVLVAALALSACGGGANPTPSGKTFNLDASEFAFAPNAFNAKVGEEITFSITNKGALEHNFVVFDPFGSELGRVAIPLGSTATLKVKPAAAGAYAIDCDVPGHKEAGMAATLTVSQ